LANRSEGGVEEGGSGERGKGRLDKSMRVRKECEISGISPEGVKGLGAIPQGSVFKREDGLVAKNDGIILRRKFPRFDFCRASLARLSVASLLVRDPEIMFKYRGVIVTI